MSSLRVTSLKGRTGNQSPTLPDGAVVTGVVTATSFSGDGSGLTGVASTDNIVTGTAATFTGGVNISGASNISVTGIITATSFVGDGSSLTGIAGFTSARAYTFNQLFS